MYARHVGNLNVNNVNFSFTVEDERPAVVLDDVNGAVFSKFTAEVKEGVPEFVGVDNAKKRSSNFEYVKERSYISTTVSDVSMPEVLP